MDQYTATSSPVAIETAPRRDINISMSGSSSSKNMIAPEERSARAKQHWISGQFADQYSVII